MDRPIIRLNKYYVNEAKAYSKKILAIVAGYGPNYTGATPNQQRYFVGRCGEFAVTKWAEGLDMDFEETVNEDGFPDKQDHIFFSSDLGPSVNTNVKNSHHPRAKKLMIPIKQLEKYQQDYYIGATGILELNAALIKLWGCITHDEFMRKCLPSLHPINSRWVLLEHLPLSMNDFYNLAS